MSRAASASRSTLRPAASRSEPRSKTAPRHHPAAEPARRDHHRPHRAGVEVEPGQRRQPLHLHAAVGREVVVGEDRVGRQAQHRRVAEEEGEVAGQQVGLLLVGGHREHAAGPGRAGGEQLLDQPAAGGAGQAGDVDRPAVGQRPPHPRGGVGGSGLGLAVGSGMGACGGAAGLSIAWRPGPAPGRRRGATRLLP